MSRMSEQLRIEDVPDRNRFETRVDGIAAEVEYRVEGDTLRLIHTNVPEELEGRGVGSRLARFALEEARRRRLRVWPDCPFVAAYIRRHPEYLDLVHTDFPRRAELERGAGEAG